MKCTAKDSYLTNLKKSREINFIFRTPLYLCFNPKYVLRQRLPEQFYSKTGTAVVTKVQKAQQKLDSIPDQYLGYSLVFKWICNWKILGMAVVTRGGMENSCLKSNAFLHQSICPNIMKENWRHSGYFSFYIQPGMKRYCSWKEN